MEHIEFVRSQVEYYGKHLGGSNHDQYLIHGLFMRYSRELKELEKELEKGLTKDDEQV